MATYLENLTSARDGAAAQLAALYASASTLYVTYSENGRTFQWGEKEAQLLKTIEQLNNAISAADSFEVITYGYQ